jgi:lipoprotein-releasing system permease protein
LYIGALENWWNWWDDRSATWLNLTSLIKGRETVFGHQFLSGDIYFVDFLPSQVESMDVLIVSGTAIILSLLATWYPATKASQMNPARVLSSKYDRFKINNHA